MLQELIIDISDYSMVKILGVGTYGNVYLVEEKKTKKLYAAKVSKTGCIDKQNQTTFFQELIALSKMKNAAILSLRGFSMVDFQMKYHPTILIQYMPNGSLANLIVNNNKFPLSKKYIILLRIAEGMKYLHSIA
ncbi:hypothetical protein M9Y10_039667 [Tritrichomonas musculus]|uniref:non-specific serine/threonine protein kinase n=1 Tax=Tritrichomonas musculus TaxID=1915356 RepID=A0ABR2GQZ0_9EUKA